MTVREAVLGHLDGPGDDEAAGGGRAAGDLPLLLCYRPCSTCARARAWLEAAGIAYRERDIKADNPGRQEIEDWQEASGLPLRRFFNTSGKAYRSLDLARRLPGMSREEALDLLSSDGMLLKRPILVTGSQVLVGFRPDQWADRFGRQADRGKQGGDMNGNSNKS